MAEGIKLGHRIKAVESKKYSNMQVRFFQVLRFNEPPESQEPLKPIRITQCSFRRFKVVAKHLISKLVHSQNGFGVSCRIHPNRVVAVNFCISD